MITINRKNPTPGEVTSSLSNAENGGLHFDGAAGRIDIASPPDLGTKFSFEFVLKADSFGSSNLYFLDFGNGGRFIFGTHSSISYNWGIFDNTSWKSFGVKLCDDLKVHHLVVTIDSTSATLFDNGVSVGTATISASHGIDSCSDAFIGSAYSSAVNLFEGTLSRTRFYNRVLSSSEIKEKFENKNLEFSEMWASQTTINSGTTTNGKRYRITARDGVDFTTVGAANNNIGTQFTATGSVTLDANDTVVQIGAVTDYCLSEASPTASLMLADRSTNSVDATISASGVEAISKPIQISAVAARIGTSAITPADNELVAGKLRVYEGASGATADTTADALVIDTNQSQAGISILTPTNGAANIFFGDSADNNAGRIEYSHSSNAMEFRTAGTSRLKIDSAGKIGVNQGAPVQQMQVTGNGSGSTAIDSHGYGLRVSDENHAHGAVDIVSSGDVAQFIARSNVQGNFSFKSYGSAANALIERMSISSTGAVQVLSDGGSNNPAHLSLWAKDTSIVANDVIGTILGQGSDNAASPPLTGAKINFVADADWDGGSSNYQSSRIDFFTQNNSGTDTLTSPRMTISSAGLVTVKAGVDDSFNSGLKVVRSLNGDSIFMNCKGGSANFNSLSNSGVGLAYKFLTNGTERLGIGTAGTVTINKPQDTTTGTPFSSAALKLLPSGTQNTTGLTSIALSTSVSDNYGFLISGHRAGSSGTPTMRISSHNNSSTGTEVLNINNAGLAKFTGDTQIGDGYVTNYVKHVAGLDHTIAVSFTFPSQATRWVHHLIELRMAMGSDGATAATPTFVRYAIASNTSITAITQMDANLGGDISVATSTSGTTLTITFTEANSYAMNSVTAFATLTAGHGDAKPTGMTVA